MKLVPTPLAGCFVIEDQFFGDERGYFFESFNQKTFEAATGQSVNFVQDNQSMSKRGVLRGLHFQQHEHAQAKLVRVLQGSVLDVVVDIRKGSATYGQTFSIELTESNHKQLFVPRGFAHGFLVTSETAVFFYKVDNYYNKASEQGIMYNDPQLAIDWGMDAAEFLLSEKDQQLPYLQAIEPQEVKI